MTHQDHHVILCCRLFSFLKIYINILKQACLSKYSIKYPDLFWLFSIVMRSVTTYTFFTDYGLLRLEGFIKHRMFQFSEWQDAMIAEEAGDSVTEWFKRFGHTIHRLSSFFTLTFFTTPCRISHRSKTKVATDSVWRVPIGQSWMWSIITLPRLITLNNLLAYPVGVGHGEFNFTIMYVQGRCTKPSS